jgi:hypothetical protein
MIMSKVYNLLSKFCLGACIFGLLSYAGSFSEKYRTIYFISIPIIFSLAFILIYFDESTMKFLGIQDEKDYHLPLYFILAGILFTMILYQWI